MRPFGEIKSEDEADPQFLPPIILPTEYCDTLQGSMEQLAKGLETGVVLIQFEVIFLKYEMGMSIRYFFLVYLNCFSWYSFAVVLFMQILTYSCPALASL